MNIDSVLRAEVAALLGERPPTPVPNTVGMSPLRQALALAANEERLSMFATTWNMLGGGNLEVKHENGTKPDDCSDVAAALAGVNSSKVFNCGFKYVDAPTPIFAGTAGDQCNAETAGPPSQTDSFHGLKLVDNASNPVEPEPVPPTRIRKRSCSKTSTHSAVNANLLDRSSKVFIHQGSGLNKKPSEGLNAIMKDSSTSTVTGSTHRAASKIIKGPRCAQDYIQKVLDSELDRKKFDIPSAVYKYECDADENMNPMEKPPCETPVLRDTQVSPISKSFLDSVNEQIQQIKYHQAKERVMFGSRGEPGGIPPTLDSNIKVKAQETMAVGTEKIRTTIIDARNKIKMESEMQTDNNSSVNSSGMNTPSWDEGSTSKMDSQLSLPTVRPRKSTSRQSQVTRKRSFYPLEVDVNPIDESSPPKKAPANNLRVRGPPVQEQSYLGRFVNLRNAFGATKYGLQAAWNTAEEIFCGYIIPPDLVDDSQPTQREIQETEDNVTVSMLRLMGVPMEVRHAIYREVLGELQVVNDFSVGTVQALTNVIDWLCTGKPDGTRDLVAKTRFLATCQTEVDPDSESWKQFERDLSIFTNAVVDTVGSAARTMSRQCHDSCDSLMSKLSDYAASHMSDGQISVQESGHRSSTVSFADESQTRVTTRGSNDDSSSVHPSVIPPMVTESEFELPPSARTESTTSNVSSEGYASRGRRSRIPVCVNVPLSNGKVPAYPSKSDREFSLNVLRDVINNSTTHTSVKREESANYLTARSDSRSNTRLNMSSNHKLTHKATPRVSSTSSRFGMPRSYANQYDPRERYLSSADARLLAECKRLVGNGNMQAGRGGSSATSRASVFNATQNHGHYESQSSVNSVTEHPSAIPLLPTEPSDIASVIASVASSVTSALLGPSEEQSLSSSRTNLPTAESHANGPAAGSSTPTLLETIQEAAISASRAIFGVTDPAALNGGGRTIRTNNRFNISPESWGQPIAAPSTSNRQSVLQQYNLPQPTVTEAVYPAQDPAWELFEYIKREEAKRELSAKRSSQASLPPQAHPSESKPESSVTARLSKAALTGLFNTFKESIPAPLITINQGTETTKSPTVKRTGSGVKYRTASGHSYLVNPVRSSTTRLGRTLRSPSTPSVKVPQCSEIEFSRKEAEVRMQEDLEYIENVINALLESSKNTATTSRPSSSVSTATQIQPSTVSPATQIASSKVSPPTHTHSSRISPATHLTLPSQNPANKTKIPLRASIAHPSNENKTKPLAMNPSRRAAVFASSKSVNSSATHASVQRQQQQSQHQRVRAKSVSRLRADVNSNIEASSPSSSRPRIIHSTRTQSKQAPVKPKVQVISPAVNRQPPNNPARSVLYNNNNPGQNRTPRSGCYACGSNNHGSSYLELAKLKQNPQQCLQRRDTGSYSRIHRNPNEGTEVVVASNRTKSLPRRQPIKAKERDPSYRYDDGTFTSQNGSSKGSSNCSSSFPSNIPSTLRLPVPPDTNNYSEDFPNNDEAIQSSAKAPPLFFPPLERSNLPVPPLLINPFSRLRKDQNLGSGNSSNGNSSQSIAPTSNN